MSEYTNTFLNKQPHRTSIQSGRQWVQEVLSANDAVCYENFHMPKELFHSFCSKLVEHGLRRSTHVEIEEMVVIFLYTIGHGLHNRLLQERFQHSGETISRHFHNVLAASYSLSSEMIRSIDPDFSHCHPKIRNSQRYFPAFKDAIGCIDGTHIKCVVPRSEMDRYIGRKGCPTQNVMAVCDWDMCFTFVVAGWEGTVHDARILKDAISDPSLNFPHPPHGKFYLVDSGYPSMNGYLTPYRCERYHLQEFTGRSAFKNSNERFNYYHASLRSTIERTFGVWKQRFAILHDMPPYAFETQVQIVCATMGIHNFIRRNSQADMGFGQGENENLNDIGDNNEQPEGSSSTGRSSQHMNRVRDSIRDILSSASANV